MSGTRYSALLQREAVREPASIQAIANLEASLGVQLPHDYKSFLGFTNGYEGPIGSNDYTSIAEVEDIVSKQSAYEVNKNVPGFLMIGSNGAGEAYGFDMCSGSWKVTMIPFIPMTWDDSILAGDSFEVFLQNLALDKRLNSSSEA